jgi:hypothetical protein
MKYSDLIFPKAMNLDTLSEILSDDQMMTLIKKYKDKERRARRIILPSGKLLRKCIIYHFAIKHKEDFKKVLRELKEKGIEERRDKIIELFQQRCKELANE